MQLDPTRVAVRACCGLPVLVQYCPSPAPCPAQPERWSAVTPSLRGHHCRPPSKPTCSANAAGPVPERLRRGLAFARFLPSALLHQRRAFSQARPSPPLTPGRGESAPTTRVIRMFPAVRLGTGTQSASKRNRQRCGRRRLVPLERSAVATACPRRRACARQPASRPTAFLCCCRARPANSRSWGTSAVDMSCTLERGPDE